MKQQAGNIKGSVWDEVDKPFGEEIVPVKKMPQTIVKLIRCSSQ